MIENELLNMIVEQDDHREEVRSYLDSLNLPDWIYNCFLGELIKIFGTNWMIPDENYDNPMFDFDDEEDIDDEYLEDYEDLKRDHQQIMEESKQEQLEWKRVSDKQYSYKDQIDFSLDMYFSGTAGWARAFKLVCDESDNSFLVDTYNKLPWMNSEYFDEYLKDQTVRVMFDTNLDNRIKRNQAYAEFLRQKNK